MALDSLSRQLERRLLAIEKRIDTALATPTTVNRLDRWALQDGYLSQSWQAWCVFCRELILNSAQGVVTANNQPTGSPHAGRPPSELAWIGMKASRGDPVGVIRPIAAMRHEPTWGDIGKFSQVVQAFNLTNEATVLSGVLSAGGIIRHVQTIRNAAAHMNTETFNEVRALATFYVASPINTPGDAIFWIDPTTRDFVYRTWTARMIAASNQAVS